MKHVDYQYIENDLKHHTLVAYAVKKGDDKIENPVGRILIKKYNINSNGKNHTIYRTESDTYGNAPSDFKNQVEDLMKKHYPATENHSYEIQDGLFDDGRAYIVVANYMITKMNTVSNNLLLKTIMVVTFIIKMD